MILCCLLAASELLDPTQMHVQYHVVTVSNEALVIEGVGCTFCILSGHSSLEMGEDSMADKMARYELKLLWFSLKHCGSIQSAQ